LPLQYDNFALVRQRRGGGGHRRATRPRRRRQGASRTHYFITLHHDDPVRAATSRVACASCALVRQVSVRALVEYAEAKKGKADVEVRHTSYSSCGQLAPYSNATPLSHVRPAACVFFSWSLVRCWKTCSRSKASSTAPTHTRPPPPPPQLLPPLLPHPQRRRQPSIDQHEARGGALRAVLSWCHCLAPS